MALEAGGIFLWRLISLACLSRSFLSFLSGQGLVSLGMLGVFPYSVLVALLFGHMADPALGSSGKLVLVFGPGGKEEKEDQKKSQNQHAF
jgi:hypothetical protein